MTHTSLRFFSTMNLLGLLAANRRLIAFVAFIFVLGAVVAGLGGCAATIGSEQAVGTSRLVNPSPVTLHIKDLDKEGTANGTGPARYTSVTEDGIQTIQTGSTPRDLYAAILPDGTVKFNLSSGTDINAEGLEFDPSTRALKVAKFGTSASEPLRAGNEAYDRLVTYWQARDEASKQAIIEQIRTTGQVTSDMVPVILQLLSGL